jgi:hypothetical protein
MRSVLVLIGTLALTPAARGQSPADAPAEDWVTLLNGRDLSGWTPKLTHHDLGQDPRRTFRVEDGVLKVAYDDYEGFDRDFGHLFYETPFSYYVLRLEYRFLGEQVPGGPDWALRNSGVMFHSQPPETMGREQDFPVCIEAQFLGGAGEGERTTGNLCTPGTHVVMDGELVTQHCITSSSATYHGDRWVQAELRVYGSERVEHVIDGEVVLSYEKPQLDGEPAAEGEELYGPAGTLLDHGYIALQAESHPLEFRNVELLDLVGCPDPGSPGYKPYAAHHDESRCGEGE